MGKSYQEILKSRLDDRNYNVLTAIKNDRLLSFVADAVELCNPESVWVSTDSEEDVEYNRQMVVKLNEEKRLGLEGHTIHFDGMQDQGRDRVKTRYLVPGG